ncbi:MAG: hypothetical protein KDD72_12905, partial [Anaerolineales bacterium]|nr:hypothetical protein [Anaerolineales bacterium]
LGAGTLSLYGDEGDYYRFYEINETVIRLAEGEDSYFTFLRDSKENWEIVPGDARISLENELASGESQNFDVLVLDVFSSDSIPVHLITKEAFSIYLQHLLPNGIIAAHVSNRYLDLQPVLWKLAEEFGLSVLRVDKTDTNFGEFPSIWILLSRDPSALDMPNLQAHAFDLSSYQTGLPLWTDDYSNLFQILK